MSEIDKLHSEYERFVRTPWDRTLAGAQKVWFAIYDPAQERRLRMRFPDFEVATRNAGHGWISIDLTDSFAHWMAQHDYREAYFEAPELMEPALDEFAAAIANQVQAILTSEAANDQTVVAVVGLATLFGLTRASKLLRAVDGSIRGRMLVFFPGHHEGSNYRLLDARDGWNYLAVPIAATS
jgi:hypothetical protein